MTIEQIEDAAKLHIDKRCDVCPLGGTNKGFQTCTDELLEELRLYVMLLKSENAALRARLGKFDDLHLHMGEKVYIIADDNEIIERFICGVHILSTEIIFVTTTQKNYKPCNKKGIAAHIAHAFENSFGLLPLRDFGERAFIHRESALARLAELKGGQDG